MDSRTVAAADHHHDAYEHDGEEEDHPEDLYPERGAGGLHPAHSRRQLGRAPPCASHPYGAGTVTGAL